MWGQLRPMTPKPSWTNPASELAQIDRDRYTIVGIELNAACFQEPEGDSSTSIKLWAG
jgi:hypothetical protein